MPTTPLGITYPASTDHTRLWEHLQNLATTADTAIGSDSGIVSLPPTGAWTNSTNNPMTIRKIGKMVLLNGSWVRSSSVQFSDAPFADFATLPAGMAPPNRKESVVSASGWRMSAAATAAGTLALRMWKGDALPAGDTIYIDMSWSVV